MTGYTNNYSLPYPQGSSPVVVHTDMERLASMSDLAIGSVEADITDKVDTAKTEAISAASQDATTKAGAAQTAAINYVNQELTEVEAELDNIDASSKKWRLLTDQDVLHELPPGKYALSHTGVASEELGYPDAQRGLLFVDYWTGSQASRILRYFAADGRVYTRSISPSNLRQWNLLTNHQTYLTADDHLYDLPAGRYALSSSTVASPELGYPTNSRGTLLVEEFSSSGNNRTLFYIAESGGVYVQVFAGGNPRGWVDLSQGVGTPTPTPGGGGLVDTTPRLLAHTEQGHGFYKGSTSGSWDPNDTSTKAVGLQSVRLTTDGDGADTIIRLDDTGPFDITQANPNFWIRIPDWTHATRLRVYLGTDGMDDHYRWNFTAPANKSYLEEGYWRRQTFSQVSADHIVGDPDPTRLTHIQVMATDDGEGQFSYNLGPFYETPKSNAYPNGVVSMSFDDGRLNNYTIAKPIMDKYGFPGTAYVVTYSIGTTNRMTVEHLKEMQDISGWEIGCHTYAEGFHTDRLTSFTEEELVGDMENFVQWQKNNGLKVGTLAYPGGTYNDLVKRVTLRYFKAGRAIHRFWETLPPNDLGSLTTAEYVSYPRTTPDDVREKVALAQQHGAWLHICFHGVEDESTSALEYPTHLFEEICEILYDSGIPVRTVAQVVDSL